jgi:hypothetical protein
VKKTSEYQGLRKYYSNQCGSLFHSLEFFNGSVHVFVLMLIDVIALVKGTNLGHF